ncbi:MAG TPA: O-methyltransferase [Acidimicrobiales bacterium]|nr:O-methyltransferase [Acidimicrobiales bacterium]HWI03376.1 O-methyltransferase [Acidimicrobiales bacterium]
MGVVDEDIEAYAAVHTTPEDPLLARVAADTRATQEAHGMMVGLLEGRFLETLVWLSGARRILEIGCFTGYSALSMAAALPPEGTITTCEVDPERAAIARRHFDASPWADRIDLIEGPALESLTLLMGPFDLVFIDADKASYARYYEAVLPLLADRGLIVVDNVLWNGRVLDETDQSEDTRAIRAFNDMVVNDPRVTCVMATVRDGVLLIRRRDG